MITDDDHHATNAKLAELLGWLYNAEGYDPERCWRETQGKYNVYPNWTRDWAACGPLIGEHGLEIINRTDHVAANYRGTNLWFFKVEYYADHATKDDAIRYAIVQAVIAKLEAGKEPK